MEFASWNVPSKHEAYGKGALLQRARSGVGAKRTAVPLLDDDTLEELDLMPTKVRRTHMDLVSAREQIAALEQQLSSRDTLIDILVSQLRCSGGSSGGSTAGSSGGSSAAEFCPGRVAGVGKNLDLQVRADPVIPAVPFNNIASPVQLPNEPPHPSLVQHIVPPVAQLQTKVAIASVAMRAVKPSAAPTTVLSSSIAAAAAPKPASSVRGATMKLLAPELVVAAASPPPVKAAAVPATLALQHPTLLKHKKPVSPPPAPVAAGVDDELEEVYELGEEALEEEAAAATEQEEACEEEEDEEDAEYVEIKLRDKKQPMGFFFKPSTGYLHRVAKDSDGDHCVGELVAKYDPLTKTITERYVQL